MHHPIANQLRIKIVPSVVRPFDYPVPIGSLDWHYFFTFFQLGMAGDVL